MVLPPVRYRGVDFASITGCGAIAYAQWFFYWVTHNTYASSSLFYFPAMFHGAFSALKKETPNFAETLLPVSQNTWRHIPEEYIEPVHCCLSAVAQWLRCCATNREVAGSIPDYVIAIFHWQNPSDRTMALGSTQPPTQMSTRSISWGGKTGRCVRLTTLPSSWAIVT